MPPSKQKEKMMKERSKYCSCYDEGYKKGLSSLHSTWVKEQMEKVENMKATENEIERQQENGEWNVYSNQHKNKVIDEVLSLLNSKE